MNTRRHLVDTDEPVEIKMYEFEDVERLARRREEEAKVGGVWGRVQRSSRDISLTCNNFY